MTMAGISGRSLGAGAPRPPSYDRQQRPLDGVVGRDRGRGTFMQRMIENLGIGPYAMRYSVFVPRLYNLCRSLGFERHRMLPSRAFCSDESQGYPVILMPTISAPFPLTTARAAARARST